MKTKLFVAAALAAVSVGYAAAQAKTVETEDGKIVPAFLE